MQRERGPKRESTQASVVNRRRPRSLLLDLDETLVDNQGIGESVRRTCDLIAATFPGFDAMELLEANTRAWAAYWAEVEKLCWLGRLDGAAASREGWRLTLEACGCADEAIASLAFEHYQQLSREALRLFPDVGALLTGVAELDVRLALVTNGPADLQHDKLLALGVHDAFDAVIISGEIGVAKPDAVPFQLAIERLGVESTDVWHVGDSLVTDVGGARAAGVTAVWLNRRGTVRQANDLSPDLEVASLLELAGCLREPDSIPWRAEVDQRPSPGR